MEPGAANRVQHNSLADEDVTELKDWPAQKPEKISLSGWGQNESDEFVKRIHPNLKSYVISSTENDIS